MGHQATAHVRSSALLAVRVADHQGTPLGEDRPAGERIQAIAFKVVVARPECVTPKEIRPTGTLAGRPAIDEQVVAGAESIFYIGWFDERGAPLRFAPGNLRIGDVVALVEFDVSENCEPGSDIAVWLDPRATELINEAGTRVENLREGTLALGDAVVHLRSESPQQAGDLSVGTRLLQPRFMTLPFRGRPFSLTPVPDSLVTVRGDANSNGGLGMDDVFYLTAWFGGSVAPPPYVIRGDANSDGYVDPADIIYLQNFLLRGGPGPVPLPCNQ